MFNTIPLPFLHYINITKKAIVTVIAKLKAATNAGALEATLGMQPKGVWVHVGSGATGGGLMGGLGFEFGVSVLVGFEGGFGFEPAGAGTWGETTPVRFQIEATMGLTPRMRVRGLAAIRRKAKRKDNKERELKSTRARAVAEDELDAVKVGVVLNLELVVANADANVRRKA